MTTTVSTAIENQSGDENWLSSQEFMLLEVLCDTFFPTLDPPAGSSEALTAYYHRRAHDLRIAHLMAQALGQENEQTRAEIHQLLALMANPASGVLLAGSAKKFVKLSFEQRQRYVLSMANSPLGQLRRGFQAMKRLAGFLYFSAPNEQGVNENWHILDYTPPTPPLANALQTIHPLTIAEDTQKNYQDIDADVVIIGSGAGGGVAAAEFAAVGKSVIVLEKGGYNNEANFTLQEAQAMPELYLKRGMLSSKDLAISVLAGSTLGGGTTVNWTTSLRTPADVLEEWEQRSGLMGRFTGSQLQESFAAVERRVHVNTDNSEHNRQNQLLADGCTNLGYHAGVLPRNAVDCEQRCGTCGFGCRYGSKQSTMKTYLQDAYNRGARIIVNCSVEKVLLENGHAAGVKATATDRQTGKTFALTVHAKTVIVAAGSINSPAVLLRSGIENQHIGRHLHLHPTTTIAGVYSDKVYGWQGVMQSAYSSQFRDLDGNYGYTLEVPPAHPGLLGMSTPWSSAREYREQMAQAAHLATIIVLTRDKGEGTVSLDRDGEPVIDYKVSSYDRKHLLHGLSQATRAHFAAGATNVTSLHTRRTQLDRGGDGPVDAEALRAFDRQLKRQGMGPNRVMMFSAHQMGTCRMGADAKTSVTNEYGEVHGVKGLFVADGSLFPAASGVNPMLSILSLVHSNCQYIKAEV